VKVARTNEYEDVVAVPDVVRMTVVAVQPHSILIVLQVEHVEVGIRISYV
jgi:hypothetical protein